MKRYESSKHLTLECFNSSLATSLSKVNRWVKLADSIPRDKIVKIYESRLSNAKTGAPNKDARKVIGALIIKHKFCLSDVETIELIQENPYLQYFIGLSEFTDQPIFDPSLFVTIRKRLGNRFFNNMSLDLLNEQIALSEKAQQNRKSLPDNQSDKSVGKEKGDNPDKVADTPIGTKMKVDPDGVPHQGSMKIDATCVNAEVRYPTDIDLLNDAREVSDRIIDRLCKELKVQRSRTYRQVARSNYLNIIKRRNKSSIQVRMGVRGQLGFFKRTLGYIGQLINRARLLEMAASWGCCFFIKNLMKILKELLFNISTTISCTQFAYILGKQMNRNDIIRK